MNESVKSSEKQFYRVVIDENTATCRHCGNGRHWSVAYTDDDSEEVMIGTSWGDEETTQDICDLMNMAYDKGWGDCDR